MYPGMIVGSGQAVINAGSNPFYNMAATNMVPQSQQINYAAANRVSTVFIFVLHTK